ncbi:5535_t:CDS:2, partial [Rhizophagus irregularis]
DPIVSKLKKSELNPIMLENAYYSPEESEVDSDNDSNENRIVIRDIKWRSDCVIANVFKKLFGLCSGGGNCSIKRTSMDEIWIQRIDVIDYNRGVKEI